MKKNKKKAFTLVELLAVIVILAVILIIAIPQIMNTIQESRLKSMESSARLIATNAEKDYLAQQAINPNYDETSIPCTDVAKLNDNYSSCTITYNLNGVATVKLKGASGSKFAGIKCSGTKDSISCTQGDPNAPEYLYTFEYSLVYAVTNETLCKPAIKSLFVSWGETDTDATLYSNNVCTNSSDIGTNYSASQFLMDNYWMGYTYTVTNQTACKNWILYNDLGYDINDEIYPEDDSHATKVCSNSNDIWEDGSNESTSLYFGDRINTGTYVYDEMTSFLTRSDNAFDSFVTRSNTAVADYSLLNKNVFIRWPGDTTEFTRNDDPEICILYRGNGDSDINCFSNKYSADNLNHATQVFGESNCRYAQGGEIWKCTNGDVYCHVPTEWWNEARCHITSNGVTNWCAGSSCTTSGS
ncbi:MAG: prepilin-type N-terminal cleavage/methylation domain-containing protein [Bacilli bacterium]|nr:prepilin-type N-terminal cleavage/methylation domain-containing protein [Bacilli bacterium]